MVTQQDTLLGQGLLKQDHTNLSFIYLFYVNTQHIDIQII